MKKNLITGLTLLLLVLCTKPGLAADAPAAATSSNSWGGIYLGGNLGYGWGGADWNSVAVVGGPADFGSGQHVTRHDTNGVLGGGQVGLNFQRGPAVIGIESAYSGASIDGDSLSKVGSLDDHYTTRISRLFSTTTRAGYSWRYWLGYLRAGYAFGNVTSKFLDVAGPEQGTGRREEIHHGFTVGSGIEYRLTPNIVLGTEYNYINLASKNHQLGGTGTLVGTHKLKINPEGLHTITARLSFLFVWVR